MSDLRQQVSTALAAEPLLEGLQLRDHAWATIGAWDGEPEDGYILGSYTEALEAEVERLQDALVLAQSATTRLLIANALRIHKGLPDDDWEAIILLAEEELYMASEPFEDMSPSEYEALVTRVTKAREEAR